jgi:hypothetical protein
MKPESFQEFLIEDVGFEKFEELGTPRGSSKGSRSVSFRY